LRVAGEKRRAGTRDGERCDEGAEDDWTIHIYILRVPILTGISIETLF